MSEYHAVRGHKLTFKGDKVKTKKKKPKDKKTRTVDDSQSSAADISSADATAHHAWTSVKTVHDLKGPVSIFFNSQPVRCLAVDSDQGVVQGVMAQTNHGTLVDSLSMAQPEAVGHVLVAQRVRNTGSTSKTADSDLKYTFKAFDGKYLSCDAAGTVTVDQLAVGPREMWTPVIRETGISLQSVYDTFLTVGFDPQHESSPTPWPVDCKTDQIGFCQTFVMKCQTRGRSLASTDPDAPTLASMDTANAEQESIKRYQSGRTSHPYMVTGHDRVLKRARRDGKMAEALLDRRERQKSDRYCK
ncbi:hypothetical protein H4R34_000150 [Dimargaris verticillata]|uniref:FRG1-like family-domain-containing protein n=1 Tax=Dimargaris verticillata TaxID=2761393 RepID=A0A9W8BD49_9FUNG|nr:hypothetical protein H4R34_000150 [Dimargaris verticillata]